MPSIIAHLGASNDPGASFKSASLEHAVSGPVFFRKFQLMVEQVHGDEGVGSRKLGSEDGPESDSSNPDDAHRLTDPYLGVVVDDAEARGDRIRKEG